MSRVNGQLLICDRCRRVVFLKCTGEGETDGGYTRWNNFEPAPEGWELHHDVGLLCPECNSLWHDTVEAFKELRDA